MGVWGFYEFYIEFPRFTSSHGKGEKKRGNDVETAWSAMPTGAIE
jgi:hypothetical protein